MWQFGSPTATAERESPEQVYRKLKDEVHRQVVEALDLSQLARWSPDRLHSEVRSLVDAMARRQKYSLDEETRSGLVQDVLQETFGLGPLEPLLADKSISDILVNGAKEVYVERGGRLELTGIEFTDNAHLTRVIQRICANVGRRVDESSPTVDARLPDGSRVNAIFPPLALNGPVLSIRRFGYRLTADDLLSGESWTTEMLTVLQAVVRGRLNLMISGGTGSGKTTLLNILSEFIPPGERVVTIEDSAELQLRGAHIVRLETRPANVEGAGEVSQRQLVRNSLRMRPDRILIGEVRGAEALDMLQAMNTGHDGSLTTIHANDTRDALHRLETMVAMAGFAMPLEVVRSYIGSALTVVVHLARLAGGVRKVVKISELRGLKQGRKYVLRDLFVFDQTGVVEGQAVGQFRATGNTPEFLKRLKAAGIELSEDLFAARELYPQLAFDAEVIDE